jgi:hypothetical protein
MQRVPSPPASSTPPTKSEIVERLRDQGMLPMQVTRDDGVPGTSGARAVAGTAALVRVGTRQPRSALAITRELATLPGGPAARPALEI